MIFISCRSFSSGGNMPIPEKEFLRALHEGLKNLEESRDIFALKDKSSLTKSSLTSWPHKHIELQGNMLVLHREGPLHYKLGNLEEHARKIENVFKEQLKRQQLDVRAELVPIRAIDVYVENKRIAALDESRVYIDLKRLKAHIGEVSELEKLKNHPLVKALVEILKREGRIQ